MLNHANPGERIFITSYGSGAGSDAFSFVVTDAIDKIRPYDYNTDFYLRRREYINYGKYARFKGVLR